MKNFSGTRCLIPSIVVRSYVIHSHVLFEKECPATGLIEKCVRESHSRKKRS